MLLMIVPLLVSVIHTVHLVGTINLVSPPHFLFDERISGDISIVHPRARVEMNFFIRSSSYDRLQSLI